MKKVKIFLMLISAVILTGCSNYKEAITVEDFSDKAKSSGFEVVDLTDQVDYADNLYYIKSDAFDFKFIDGKKKYDIEGLFVDECKNIVSNLGANEYKKDVGSGSNWAYFEASTEDNYYYIAWIDDTLIQIDAPIGRKKQLKELVDKLGY